MIKALFLCIMLWVSEVFADPHGIAPGLEFRPVINRYDLRVTVDCVPHDLSHQPHIWIRNAVIFTQDCPRISAVAPKVVVIAENVFKVAQEVRYSACRRSLRISRQDRERGNNIVDVIVARAVELQRPYEFDVFSRRSSAIGQAKGYICSIGSMSVKIDMGQFNVRTLLGARHFSGFAKGPDQRYESTRPGYKAQSAEPQQAMRESRHVMLGVQIGLCLFLVSCGGILLTYAVHNFLRNGQAEAHIFLIGFLGFSGGCLVAFGIAVRAV